MIVNENIPYLTILKDEFAGRYYSYSPDADMILSIGSSKENVIHRANVITTNPKNNFAAIIRRRRAAKKREFNVYGIKYTIVPIFEHGYMALSKEYNILLARGRSYKECEKKSRRLARSYGSRQDFIELTRRIGHYKPTYDYSGLKHDGRYAIAI